MTKIPTSIYAESTPNPAVLKFVANHRLAVEGALHEFKNIDDTAYSPLAMKLFHFPFVREVFISDNYVSITKYDLVEWIEVQHELRDFIRTFIEDGETVIDIEKYEAARAETAANGVELEIVPQEGIETRIVEILDEYVRPAVAQDGGNIAFESYRDGVVKVQLQGACNGCPSSTMTLKSGIENILKQMLPGQIREVVA